MALELFWTLFFLLFTPSLRLWVILAIFLYATLYFYLDDGPITGHRNWQRFRNLRLWKGVSPVHYEFTTAEGLAITQLDKPCLFVVMPNCSNMPLVYGFGFNGSKLPLPIKRTGYQRTCIYLLPPILFTIPLLRDWLLWSGAVADHGYESVLGKFRAPRRGTD